MSREMKARGIFFVDVYPFSVKRCKVLLGQVTSKSLFSVLNNRTLVIICRSPYPYCEELEVKKMTIIWGGTLAFILAKLKKKLFRVEKLNYNVEDQNKRIGVYYMCIDDLPI